MVIIRLLARLESLEGQMGSPANGESSSRAVYPRGRRKATKYPSSQLPSQPELGNMLPAKLQELREIFPDLSNSKQGGSGTSIVNAELQAQLKSLETVKGPPTNGESSSQALTRRRGFRRSALPKKTMILPTKNAGSGAKSRKGKGKALPVGPEEGNVWGSGWYVSAQV